MIVGTVTEIKKHEYRVGMTPHTVKAFVDHGHTVFVQKGAGEGSGFSDGEYSASGAAILENAADVWGKSDLLIKVKEPLESEFPMLRRNMVLYTYLHLAANEALTMAMLKSGCKGVAYETIQDEAGGLPCLKPMSEIAGRLSVQEGAKYLEKPFGGRGVLVGGVPGVKSAKVVILGGGVVGSNALKMAVGLGGDVTVMDINTDRMAFLDDIYGNRIKTVFSTAATIEAELSDADIVVGAVLIPGSAAPKIVKKSYLANMKKGSVIVDVAVDQGGCVETTHVTYHDASVFTVDGVVHYCVGNMPGAVPYTSTLALTNATLKYGLSIAGKGLEKAAADDAAIMKGINIYDGECTYESIAELFDIPCKALRFKKN